MCFVLLVQRINEQWRLQSQHIVASITDTCVICVPRCRDRFRYKKVFTSLILFLNWTELYSTGRSHWFDSGGGMEWGGLWGKVLSSSPVWGSPQNFLNMTIKSEDFFCILSYQELRTIADEWVYLGRDGEYLIILIMSNKVGANPSPGASPLVSGPCPVQSSAVHVRWDKTRWNGANARCEHVFNIVHLVD